MVDEIPSIGIGKKMKKLIKDILRKKEPAEEDKLALVKVKHKKSHIGGLELFEAMMRNRFYLSDQLDLRRDRQNKSKVKPKIKLKM